jgi:hypothetical protein
VLSDLVALESAYGPSFLRLLQRGRELLIPVWNRWDALHYLAIAEHGYRAAREVHGQVGDGLPRNIAFAPMYPWVIHAVHVVTRIDWSASSQLASAVALVVGLVGLERLVSLDHSERTASTTVMLVVAFPTGFFLLAGYPESLALALVVWAFVACRHGRWLLTGILLAAAVLTKFYLCVAVVPFLMELFARVGTREVRERWRHYSARSLAVVVPPALGLGAWMAWCYHLYRDPLAFVHVQAEWERTFGFPWTSISRNLYDIYHLRILNPFVGTPIEVFDLITTLLLGVVAVYVFVRVRRSYGVFLALAWCTFTFQTVLVSETREVLSLFPFFMGLATWVDGHPWRERLLLCAFVPAAYFLIDRFVNRLFAG